LDAEVELLSKPFTVHALTRNVRQILDASTSAASTGRTGQQQS
jgi:hypothetical protein